MYRPDATSLPDQEDITSIPDESSKDEAVSILAGGVKRIAISDLSTENSSQPGYWNSLIPDVHDFILAFLPLLELFKIRVVCKSFRDVIWKKTFRQVRASLYPKECSLSPLVFYVENGCWHMIGFDSMAEIWRKLPPMRDPIPVPDPDLFKDFLVAGDVGIFCVNVGKPSGAEKLIVCNPLTGETYELPPLTFSRHPVIIHVHVTLAKITDISSQYRIIVVGSAAIGTDNFSRKTEIYDSLVRKWVVVGDVPGTDFSVNDYQTGVYCERKDLLLCIGFTIDGNKGVLAFDVGKGMWMENWVCSFFRDEDNDAGSPVYYAIAQLVICSGVVYIFTEQEVGRNVTHCIDELEFDSPGGPKWKRKVTRPRQGNRALLVYPEYTCVPLKEDKLCIFNTVERSGVIYNMLDPESFESLPLPPPLDKGVMFHSLNPIGYAFEPSFGVSVIC